MTPNSGNTIAIIKTPAGKTIEIEVGEIDIQSGVLFIKTPEGREYMTHISNALLIHTDD